MLKWAVAAWLAAGLPAHSAEPDDEIGEIVVSLSVDPDRCSHGRAREVQLVQLARVYAELRGECVAVRGWRKGDALYPTYEAARSASLYGPGAQPVLGLYGDDPVLDPAPQEPVAVTVAGLAGGCEFLPPGSAGYCHSNLEGGFVILGEIRPQP